MLCIARPGQNPHLQYMHRLCSSQLHYCTLHHWHCWSLQGNGLFQGCKHRPPCTRLRAGKSCHWQRIYLHGRAPRADSALQAYLVCDLSTKAKALAGQHPLLCQHCTHCKAGTLADKADLLCKSLLGTSCCRRRQCCRAHSLVGSTHYWCRCLPSCSLAGKPWGSLHKGLQAVVWWVECRQVERSKGRTLRVSAAASSLDDVWKLAVSACTSLALSGLRDTFTGGLYFIVCVFNTAAAGPGTRFEFLHAFVACSKRF